MSNKLKNIDVKNHTYYFFYDMNIKNIDQNKIEIREKSYKNILIYQIGYLIKNLKYVKIDSVNPLYLIISKVNGYFEENNKNKYLTLFPTNKSKEIVKIYGELWGKIRDIINSITKNSDDYDEKDMKIKFNWDDKLPLNETMEIHSMIVVVRADFHENSKYYPQVFLDGCQYKL